MPRISDAIIAEVQQATDLVEYLSATVQLKKAGRTFKGLCPFHSEKSPSFHVDPVKGFYHCFGCGAGGTVFTWVMKQEGITFPEAVRKLAERAGIRIPEEDLREAPGSAERESLLATNRWAMERFAEFLRQDVGNPAKSYFKGRGVEGVTAARFHLGFAPAGGQLLAAAQRDGVSLESLAKAGLVGRREGDARPFEMFRGRVIFPILDAREQVVGFGGRTLGDAEPKYLNTAQNAVFHKGKLLYALPLARKGMGRTHQALVVEGYMDCLMAHQFGVDWCVATLGTALTEDHARFLARQVDRVTVLFDPDAAGVRAALRSLSVFARVGVELRVAMLPGELDPCEFLLENGRDRFQAVLDEAEGVVAFRIRMARSAGDWEAPEGKSRVVRELVDWASASPDVIRREMVLKEIAEKAGLGESLVRQEADAAGGRKPALGAVRPRAAAIPRPGMRDKVHRDLIRFLTEPAYAGRVAQELSPEDFAEGRYAALGAACLAAAARGEPADAGAQAARAETEEEAALWAEVLAVPVDVEGQRERCDTWVEESLKWVREQKKSRGFREFRSRLRERDGADPTVNEELERAQELARKS